MERFRFLHRQRKNGPGDSDKNSGSGCEVTLRRDDAVFFHFPDERVLLGHTFSSEAVVLIFSSMTLNPVISKVHPSTLRFGQ